MRRQRDSLAAYNERVKLLASLFNNMGLGFIGFSILRPLVEGFAMLGPFFAYWGAMGLALHGAAHYILTYLAKEMPDDDL